MKYEYWILENGNAVKTNRTKWLYWVKEFAHRTFNYLGRPTYKSNYSDIFDVYNSHGVLIAGKNRVY